MVIVAVLLKRYISMVLIVIRLALVIQVMVNRITTCSHGLQFICGNAQHKTVGELPSHSHAIAASTVNLTGSAGYFVGADSPSYSGILTVTKGSKGLTGGGGGHTQDYLNIQANITPSVNISAVGSNQSHENMPPFISIFCWKRIA